DQRSPTRTGPGSAVCAAQCPNQLSSAAKPIAMHRIDIARLPILRCLGWSAPRNPSRLAQARVRVTFAEREIIAGRPMPKLGDWKAHRLHVVRRYGFRE